MFRVLTTNGNPLKEHEKTNNHSIAVSMEVQLGLTAVDGGIEGAFKEVITVE